MMIRLRTPAGVIADVDHGASTARVSGYVAGASRFGFIIGGERCVPAPGRDVPAPRPVSMDPRAVQVREAAARYRARKAGAA